MIIVQAPVRISLYGGGTDFTEFYSRYNGAVLSTTIDKYIYIIVKKRYDEKIYVNYSRKEIVDRIEDLQHELVKEAMKLTGVEGGVEITTLADIPSDGTGLGSSSSLTAGLLLALYTYKGKSVSKQELARQACNIEIDILHKPVGIQDQYIAAYGNLRFIRFNGGNEVLVDELAVAPEIKQALSHNLLLFHTGIKKNTHEVLIEQTNNMSNNIAELQRLKELAWMGKESLERGNIDEIGLFLDEAWEIKKRLASKITSDEINAIYTCAKNAGALGGKITGSGGGGFFLLYCTEDKQEGLRYAMRGLRELPFVFENEGCRVIFNQRDTA